MPFQSPPSGGDVFVQSLVLSAQQPSVDMQGIQLPAGTAFAKVLIHARVHGNTNGFNWEHIVCTFDNDTTINDYAWSVENSNSTTATATLGSGVAGTGTASMLIGHAVADTAPANLFGTTQLLILDPTNPNSVKTVSVNNQLMTSFTSYTDVSPLQMEGGDFWVGPGAVTRITVTPVSGVLVPGSSIIVEAGVTP